MRIKHIKSLSAAVFCSLYTANIMAASPIVSNYGQIQNVQTYSSNPFWSPGSPYNMRAPQPVYAMGADLNAGECERIVQSLIHIQCLSRNNCRDVSLSDIKPTLLIQLSNLPEHNYLSACGGYVDYLFEKYVENNGNTVSTTPVAFPAGTVPVKEKSEYQVFAKNPLKKDTPKWKQEIIDRANELRELQSENGLGSEELEKQNFPTVYEDLSFAKRFENETEGYMPYKDAHAYDIPNFKNYDEWCVEENHQDREECKIRKTFAINYRMEGGINHPSNPTSYRPINLPIKLETPTRDKTECEPLQQGGSNFKQWLLENTQQPLTDGIIPKGTKNDLRIKAEWACKKCKIEFDANGGTLQGNSTVEYSYVPNSSTQVSIPTATKPDKPHGNKTIKYTFKGWYDNADESVENGPLANPLTEGTTCPGKKYYAHYNKTEVSNNPPPTTNSYTIEYKFTGGTCGCVLSGGYNLTHQWVQGTHRITNDKETVVSTNNVHKLPVCNTDITMSISGATNTPFLISWHEDSNCRDAAVSDVPANNQQNKIYYAKCDQGTVNQCPNH